MPWEQTMSGTRTPQIPFPFHTEYDTGGITGGEKDRNIRIACAWDPGRWPDGGPETPDLFWEFYMNDEVAAGYLEDTCQFGTK